MISGGSIARRRHERNVAGANSICRAVNSKRHRRPCPLAARAWAGTGRGRRVYRVRSAWQIAPPFFSGNFFTARVFHCQCVGRDRTHVSKLEPVLEISFQNSHLDVAGVLSNLMETFSAPACPCSPPLSGRWPTQPACLLLPAGTNFSSVPPIYSIQS